MCGRDSRIEFTAGNGRGWDHHRTNGGEYTGLPFGGRSGDNHARTLSISPGKGNVVSEQLISHSLRSLCPVTAQPDWGSLFIQYTGHPIDHDSVARYLSGYRAHQGFHEQCLEQIFL